MNPNTKAQKNLRLSPECRRLLALLSNMNGIGESAVVELIVRKEARARGLIGEAWKQPENGNATHGDRETR